MAGQFIARRGLKALADSEITGSLNISQNIVAGGTLTAVFEPSTGTAISGAFTAVSESFASERLKNTTDTLTGDLTVTGTITAQEFHTEFVSASILYDSGSTKFGNSADDVHQFTGKVGIGTSPSTLLHLASTGPAILTIEADTDNVTETDNARIVLKQDGGLVVGRMGYADGTNDLELTNEYLTGALTLGTNNTTRMTIDKDGLVGIGTTSPLTILHIGSGLDSNVPITLAPATGGNVEFRNTSSSGTFTFTNANGNSEKMRITSGGSVGIGVVPSQGLLHLYKNATIGTITSPNVANATLRIQDSGFSMYLDGNSIVMGGTGYISNNGVYALSFGTNNTERMIIDGSGNVGIGTSSPTEKLHISTSNQLIARFQSTNAGISGIRFQGYDTSASANVYLDYFLDAENRKYGFGFGTSAGSLPVNSGLTHADIVVDSVGNVGIGVTSPQAKLHSSAAYPTYTDAGVVFYGGTTNNDSRSGISLISYGDALGGYVGSNLLMSGTTFSQTNTLRASGYIQFLNSTTAGVTADIAFGGLVKGGTSLVERMRITSDGKVGIGTTSPSYKLDVVGEACRFVTDGNAYSHQIYGDKTDGGSAPLTVSNTNSTTTSDVAPGLVVNKYSATTSSSARFIQFYANNIGTAMGGIVGNGANNVQFVSLSDIRDKHNIKPVTGSLNKVLQLNPVEFDWIKTNEHVKAGFIAQEVEQIFPEYVLQNISNDGEEERKGLTGGMSSGIVAVLVKAIQELSAKVESLEAQLNS